MRAPPAGGPGDDGRRTFMLQQYGGTDVFDPLVKSIREVKAATIHAFAAQTVRACVCMYSYVHTRTLIY